MRKPFVTIAVAAAFATVSVPMASASISYGNPFRPHPRPARPACVLSLPAVFGDPARCVFWGK